MKYHADPECYCEQCCATATAWWQWESLDGELRSGSRYWLMEHAVADRPIALREILPVLARVNPAHALEGLA